MNRLNRVEESIVKTFIHLIITDYRKAIQKIILFGSRARGVARPSSDYDLLIITNEKDPVIKEKLYGEAYEFFLSSLADISLKITSESDWKTMKHRNSHFYKIIKKEGITLWTQ